MPCNEDERALDEEALKELMEEPEQPEQEASPEKDRNWTEEIMNIPGQEVPHRMNTETETFSMEDVKALKRQNKPREVKNAMGSYQPRGPKKGSIFVCIPNTGYLHTVLAMQMIYWAHEFNMRFYAPAGMRPISFARNICAKAFMRTDCEYMWFIDSDTIPILSAPKLLLDVDQLVVSGIVPTMKHDERDGYAKPAPMTFALQEDGGIAPHFGNGIEQIEACGCACLLIHREVFANPKMEFPWFEERSWGSIRGEDMIFCAKLKEAEIPLYANYDCICEHYKEIVL